MTSGNTAEIGYTLSGEEHAPSELVRQARRAEEVGFSFALISDHFHPWIDQQGHSAFVWAVLGGAARETEGLRLGTGVTCPIVRIHPAIIAQAAATVAAMMPGRFFLGVGTGENLNEHVTGEAWPPADVRFEMLEEAVGVIRELWKGDVVSHRGRHFTVEEARIYSLPESPPPIYVAASGPKATALAARIGDGLIGASPDAELVSKFKDEAGENKPRYGQVAVCWAADEAEARIIAHRWWPNAALKGELGQELRSPRHFEQAAKNVGVEDVAEIVACGPDPEKHLESIKKFVDAGYDHVYVHQIGPDQEGFFDFYEERVLPKLR
jgi:coenzyme F420-dependent glucose-6-phosphate dehydrogenase